MKLRLADLAPCFEGVIPSIIATAAADGTPNVSYLSHVVRVDDEHVALSNQFFAKTAANIRANPHVTLILVDCFSGEQYLLDIRFVRSLDTGPLFEKISIQLKASSAQIGMSEIMRLRSADVFRVEAIERVPCPVDTGPAQVPRPPVSLPALADGCRAIENLAEVEDIIDCLLDRVVGLLGYSHALVLVPDPGRDSFVTTGSIGYDPSGIGSEVKGSEGMIGTAAASGRTIKVSDMSRVRRFAEAIDADAGLSENTSRVIGFPGLAGVMSQIAVPMVTRGETIGILFVESPERMAFHDDDEAALELLCAAAARAIAAGESIASRDDDALPGAARSLPIANGGAIRVTHHRLDDSIFVDGNYIVKGIAGAVLRRIIEWHLVDGRNTFCNRELRLALAARMPDIKDNLETRLLLLRRRLEEKQAPIQIVRTGRGRLSLEAKGPLLLAAAQD